MLQKLFDVWPEPETLDDCPECGAPTDPGTNKCVDCINERRRSQQ